MPQIDRNNALDAKKVIEYFLQDEARRESVIDFIATAIEYANNLDDKNWNLNLDKNGQFVRFNTGREYCIELDKKNILILCNRNTLRDEVRNKHLHIIYRGHKGRQRVESEDIDEVPDCLQKTLGSIGCVIGNANITDYLGLLEQFNQEFIKDAILTPQSSTMKAAHSKGCIDYFSKVLNRQIPNPNPNKSLTEADFYKRQHQDIIKAKTLSTEQLKAKISKINEEPIQFCVLTLKYNRNPFLSEYIKRMANGTCQDCKQPAPFVSKHFNEPFLETHHVIPLSEGGFDRLDNLIALFPNCHRKRHFG